MDCILKLSHHYGIERRKNKMYEYIIYVTLKGKIYQTNVIANKNQPEKEIYQIAEEQVLKQWGD